MQRFVRQPAQDIPVAGEVDVLVVGGGPAGFGAAVAAARGGARTLLVERYGFLGGMGTVALVGPYVGRVDGGIYHELLGRLQSENALLDLEDSQNHQSFDPEVVKLVMQETVLEAGAELLLHAFASDVIINEAGRVSGVVVQGKGGLQALMARVVIDATGDGDVAAMAGAEWEKGRKSDGRMQPMTLMFRIGGVDPSRMPLVDEFDAKVATPHGDLKQLAEQANLAGELPPQTNHVLLYPLPRRTEALVNMTNVMDADGTSLRDLTKAEIESRRQVAKIMRFLRKYVPGLEDAYVIETATQVGVRETRHILGEYILTQEDVIECRRFPDAVAQVNFQIDIHAPTGRGSGTLIRIPPDKRYQIPLRCLVPRGFSNLLVAGRAISATHEAHGSVRAQPIAMALGQGAGVAASLAVTAGVALGSIDVGTLRKELLAQGVILDD